jgi:hypothetical protein
VKIFVEDCIKHISKEKKTEYTWLSQREKYDLINEIYWINGTPSKLSILLWGLQSRQEDYQKLLLQKFIAIYEKKDESIIKAIQEKIDDMEPEIQNRLWAVEKNIYKIWESINPTTDKEGDNNTVTLLPSDTWDDTERVHQNTAQQVDTIIHKEKNIPAPKPKIQIIILPEELKEVPEIVDKNILRVISLIHQSFKQEYIADIQKLMQYWYMYFKKQEWDLKKTIERPHTYFTKFHQQTYLEKICEVAEDIPITFRNAFRKSVEEMGITNYMKRMLEIHNISNKRK